MLRFHENCPLRIIEIEPELLTNLKMIFDNKNFIRRGITRLICYLHVFGKKVHIFKILILKISTAWALSHPFLLVDLNMLKILQTIKLQHKIQMKIDKEFQDIDGIATCPCGSNIPFIKYYDHKDIPNSIEELKIIYKNLTENVKCL